MMMQKSLLLANSPEALLTCSSGTKQERYRPTVTGETPNDQRKMLVQEFQNPQVQVMSSIPRLAVALTLDRADEIVILMKHPSR